MEENKLEKNMLCRGKREDNGKYEEGYYIFKPNDVCIGEDNSIHYICRFRFLDWSLSSLESFKVIPETVGRFTGILDKNNKKIYSGMCVNFNDKHNYVYNCKVCYSDKDARFYIENKEKTNSYPMSQSFEYEVIKDEE